MIVFFAVLFFSASKSPSKPAPQDPAWYTPETARSKELKNKVMVGNYYLCHDPHSPRFTFKDFAPPPVWPAKFVRRPAVAAVK